MASLGVSASGLCDFQAGVHTRPAEEVFDIRVRPLSPGEPWHRGPVVLPVLPTLPQAAVSNACALDVRASYDDVHMSDIPGSAVVTYDRHIEVKADYSEPKALYLKYRCMDPVTLLPAEVIVPAEMCLDVYVDPNMFAGPPIEEEEVEEVVEDKREEDRRKLKSSIRGDPILLRAGNAPAPEPYFSATIQDPQQVASQLRIPGRFGGGDADATGALGMASVEGHGTVSSFLKTAGRAKYVRPRLGQIDGIVYQAKLAATASMPLPGSVEEEVSQLVIPRGFGSDADGEEDSRTLAAHVAMHLRRMPPLHATARIPSASSVGRRRRAGSASASEAGSPRKYNSAEADGADSDSGGTAPAPGGVDAEHGEGGGGGDWDDAAASISGVRKRRCSAASAASAAAATSAAAAAGRRPSAAGLNSTGGSAKRAASRRSVGGSAGSAARMALETQKVKLRDLDPHISVPASRAPTQRLHCNWPDGLKRSIARHFYGLSPAKILEEEERERLKEQRPSSRSKESALPEHMSDDEGAEEGGAASDPAASTQPPRDASRRNSKVGWLEPVRPAGEERKAQERRMERSIACVGKVPHGLQVRFHANRSGRFVVGRQLPDNTSTDRWRLPQSAR